MGFAMFAVHVTFFPHARPSCPNTSNAMAQGYVVRSHKRNDNLWSVKKKKIINK